MMSFQTPVLLGGVTVMTTENRGWSTEELAQRAADKIIYVGGSVASASARAGACV